MSLWRNALPIILVTLIVTGCSFLPAEEVDAIPTLISPPESRTVTYVAELGTITQELRTVGRVAPAREYILYFAQSGRVRELNASLNQRVQPGDVLVQLDVEALKQQATLTRIDLE